MVVHQVGDSGDPGMEDLAAPKVGQLPGGEFQDDRIIGFEFVDEREGTDGDVTAETCTGMLPLQDVMQRRYGCGFALAACYGQKGRCRSLQEQ